MILINKLETTIKSDDNALHSYCLKAGFLAFLGRIEEAKSVIEIVKKKKSDFRCLYIWEAVIKIKQGERDSAIELVNKAFEKTPTMNITETIKHWSIFNEIETDERIRWPTIEIDNSDG